MKKLLPWLLSFLFAITLIAVAAIYLYTQVIKGDTSDPARQAQNSASEVELPVLTANQRVELTAELKDITTNLAEVDRIIVIDFAFQLDKKSTKEDFEKIKDIEIRPIILRVLADMTTEQISGSKGQDELNAKLLNLINPVLPKGKLTKVEITKYIVSRI